MSIGLRGKMIEPELGLGLKRKWEHRMGLEWGQGRWKGLEPRKGG